MRRRSKPTRKKSAAAPQPPRPRSKPPRQTSKADEARRQIVLELEVLDLRAVVRDTVADHAPALADRNLGVSLALPETAVRVYGDRPRLGQVLGDVLARAERSTPVSGRIDVRLAAGGSSATLVVTDSGAGLAHDHLAGVQSIIELHRGSAEVDSGGRGTRVTITLPLIRSEPAANTSPCKVLVVEDRVDAAESLRYALSLKGHSVAIAHDGHTAVELAHRFTPDVVFCDLGLPDMDGYAVARALRADGALRHVCLVALSGYARAEDVERARAAGFDRHLAKPPRLDEIDQILAGIAPLAT